MDTKCGDFTMISKLRMYARDHHLQWDVHHLPTEGSMADALLRAEIPSLMYISQMSDPRGRSSSRTTGLDFAVEVPQVEVLQAGEANPKDFLQDDQTSKYGIGLTREEKLYKDVPWPIRPLEYYFAHEGMSEDEIRTMPRRELDQPIEGLPWEFKRNMRMAYQQLSDHLIAQLDARHLASQKKRVEH